MPAGDCHGAAPRGRGAAVGDACYTVAGEGVLGPFHCTIEVPASPLLLDMPDTVRVPRDTIIAFTVPFRYEVGPEVGSLSVVGEFRGTNGIRSGYARPLGDLPSGTDTLSLYDDTGFFLSQSVQLAASGWNRVNFRRIPAGELWHAQAAEAAGLVGAGGVEGEGAYGYCDGVSYSRTAVIIAE